MGGEVRGGIQRVTIGDLVVEASLSERHAAEVEVTEHPVELGSDVADHFRPKAETLTLSCFFSDTPVDPRISATASPTNVYPMSRVKDVVDRLYAMKDGAELLEITTRWKLYRNMKLTSLSLPRDVSTGQAVKADLTFKQIRTVQSATVRIRTLKPNGKKKQNQGPKPVKPYVPEQSVALQLKNFLLGK